MIEPRLKNIYVYIYMMCIYYIVYTKQIIERVTIKREINRKNRIKHGEIGKEGSCGINNQPPKKYQQK